MTFGRLLWRNLFYHWRGNLAVLLGVAVGTAVLTGALLVGDSQRASLRQLALRRLSWVDQSLVVPRFFREELAKELQDDGAAEHVCPALLLRASVSTAAGGNARKVTVLGVDARFLSPDAQSWLGKPGSMDEVVFLNAPLARTLNVADGERVTLHLQKGASVPRETLLGRKKAEDVEETIALKARVLAADVPTSQFSLVPGPEAPRNAFVPLALLQDRLTLKGKVNALLAGGAQADLNERLGGKLKLTDWELTLRPSKQGDYLSLESPRLLLEPAAVKAVRDAKLIAAPTLVYLANTIAVTGPEGSAQVPYSVVAAIDLHAPGALEETIRQKVPRLGDDEIILTEWGDNPLKAARGERVTLDYYLPEHGGHLETGTRTFTTAAVLKMEGPLADRGLTPQVRGITDRVPSKWEAPFPLDRSRLRRSDDLFWQKHGATPKAYVSLKAGQEMWRSRFGDLTSFRIRPPAGTDPKETVEKELVAKLDPRQGGFVFDKIKEHALAASAGGTDFAMLFLAFSFFLILAALLLVGLLFRLNLDRRASEVGVLLAAGLRRRTLRWLLLGEGGILAALGALLGTGAAILYAAFLLGRLRAWWPGGLDASVLQLDVAPLSLLIGYAAAVLVSVCTVAWSVRVLGRVAPRALLQGQTTDSEIADCRLQIADLPGQSAICNLQSAIPRSLWVSGVALVGAAGCLAGGWFVRDHEARAGTFFGSGLLLLVAGLAGLTAWMRGSRHTTVRGHGTGAVGRLGIRNAARHPARSLLTTGLLASAAFLLVGVEAFRRQPGADYLDKTSGSGGFALLAESDLPVFLDLNSDRARDELAGNLERRLTQPPAGKAPLQGEELQQRLAGARELLRSITFYAFRVRAGDDASCLNLYQPRRPRLLGVPRALIDEGGFSFSATREKRDNPWQLLREKADGAVPVFGEGNTVAWMLKSGLGKSIPVPDWQGRDRELRIDGLLNDSVFQSGLLMAEENFLTLYPEEQGYSFFLLRVPAGRERAVKELLEAVLQDRGFEVTPTAERLELFLAVENMYLSTFQALGGMGLLLGTLGLAVVLLRSVWERRGELALLRALGYRRGTLGWLVLAENSFLLLLGLGLGTVAALLSVAPHLLGSGGSVAWLGLVGTLLLALAVGLLASTVATAATVRAALVPALRRE